MLSKLTLTERGFKNIINLTFLTLSSFLIVYFLVQLTPNPLIRAGICLFAVILEVFMQYLLSTGRVRWRENLRFRACVLFFFYGLYVLVYAVPSATGFFMAEINAQEQRWTRTALVEETDKERLMQISATIKNLNAQLLTESRSGYGRRSQLIMDELKRLNLEQVAVQKRFQAVSRGRSTVTKDLFKVMGDVYQIPGNVLKLLIFSISVLMVYVGLIMTSWDLSFSTKLVEIDESAREPVMETHPAVESAKVETGEEPPEAGLGPPQETVIIRDETPVQTSVTVKLGKVVCPTCGKHFPFKKDKTFCCSDCRIKAYSQSIKNKVRNAAL